MTFLKKLSQLGATLFVFAAFFGGAFLAARHPLPFWGLPPLPAFLVFLTAAHGLVTIITDSSIVQPLLEVVGKLPVIGKGIYSVDAEGNFGGLLSCSMCTGMWTGAVLAALGASIWPITPGFAGMRDIVAHGLIATGWCFFTHLAVEKLKEG